MNIDVLYFAQLKDVMGTDAESLTLAKGATVNDALAALATRPEWRRVASLPISFAVNDAWAGGDVELQDGDRLALLPPVSGG